MKKPKEINRTARLCAWLRWMKKQKAVVGWDADRRPSKWVAVVRIEAIDAAIKGAPAPRARREKP